MRRGAALPPVVAGAVSLLVAGCSARVTIEGAVEESVAVTTAEAPVTMVADPTTPPASDTTVTTSSTVAVATQRESVFGFPGADDLDGWSVVNDTVMGGVSSGELAWVDGAMAFTGELSLDNNGGFASVRSPFIDPAVAAAWADWDGLAVDVRGDGRRWAVEVRTFSEAGGWIAMVAPPSDRFAVVEVSWATFEPVTRFLDPRPSPTPLDPTNIASVAFYLIDGIEAPFRLEVRSIS